MAQTLNAVLKQWIKAAKPQALGLKASHKLETTAQAKLIGQALALIPTFPLESTQDEEGAFNHPLEDMIFLSPHTQEAYEAALHYVLPQIRRLVDNALKRINEEGVDEAAIDTELLILAVKLLIEAKQAQSDIERLVKVIHLQSDGLNDVYFWLPTFSNFDHAHPYSIQFYRQVAEQLPDGFCAVTLLDAANIFWNDEAAQKLIQKAALRHPFDSLQGAEKLRAWLDNENTKPPSYAESSAGALPFLKSVDVQELFALAQNHTHADTRLVAAWASTKLNRADAENSLQQLIDATLDYKTSEHACGCLFDLDLEDEIPQAAQQAEFRAKAEIFAGLMCTTIYDHAEPSRLELMDAREFYWPPTKDRRILYLFEYEYADNRAGKYTFPHYGLVGSLNTLLLAELSEKKSVEDLYALYSQWDMHMQSGSTPDYQDFEKRIAMGYEMLRKHNSDFAK